jgi:hypothetical protein
MGISKVVHDEETAEEAVKFLAANRGKNMDYFSILMRNRPPKIKVKDLPESDF